MIEEICWSLQASSNNALPQTGNAFSDNENQKDFLDDSKNSLLQSSDDDSQVEEFFLDIVDSIQHQIQRSESKNFIFNDYSEDSEMRDMKFIFDFEYHSLEHHIYFSSSEEETISNDEQEQAVEDFKVYIDFHNSQSQFADDEMQYDDKKDFLSENESMKNVEHSVNFEITVKNINRSSSISNDVDILNVEEEDNDENHNLFIVGIFFVFSFANTLSIQRRLWHFARLSISHHSSILRESL